MLDIRPVGSQGSSRSEHGSAKRLEKLLVCHTTTLNHMFDQRKGSLRELDEEETTRVLEFKLFVGCFIIIEKKNVM